jgi:phosphoribosylformylglycinamidine synthase subunit PurL
MWQFAEAIRGISDACRELGTPVVSGNVSFYNETEGRPILPTPTVGMVGIFEDVGTAVRSTFPAAGESVVLLGATSDELGGSEYQQAFHPDAQVAPPRVDLAKEKALIATLTELARERVVTAAHDVSNGGFAVALAESSMKGIGVEIELGGHADDLDAASLLFGESQARAIASVPPERLDRLRAIASSHGVPATHIGETVTAAFVIARKGTPLIRTTALELHRVWSEAFPKLLAGDSIEDVIEGKGETAELIARE